MATVPDPDSATDPGSVQDPDPDPYSAKDPGLVQDPDPAQPCVLMALSLCYIDER